jgi:hypothetical protein
MRRVLGPGRIVQEEGLVGRVEDELDRLVRQVFALMVPLFDRLWLRRRMVGVGQVGEPLIGLAAEEAMDAREPATQRPAVTRPRRGAFLRRIEVPLAKQKHIIAVFNSISESIPFSKGIRPSQPGG